MQCNVSLLDYLDIGVTWINAYVLATAALAGRRSHKYCSHAVIL